MKSTFLKEKEGSLLPTMLFEFDPTAQIKRKNIPQKRPQSASNPSKKPSALSDREKSSVNKLIKSKEIMTLTQNITGTHLQPKPMNVPDASKLVPSLKKLTQKQGSAKRKAEIKQMQEKFIIREKIPKQTPIPKESEESSTFLISNNESFLKNKKSKVEIDFNTIFNKFLEMDDEVSKSEKHSNLQKPKPVTQKLSASVELFIKNFENAGLERHPVKQPSKKVLEEKREAKEMQYEAKNLEGKTSAEVFQYIKTKFNISEMFSKNIQQIKELKKNFRALKEEVDTEKNPTGEGKQPEELKKEELNSKKVDNEASFDDVQEEKTLTQESRQFQSSKANVINLSKN